MDNGEKELLYKSGSIYVPYRYSCGRAGTGFFREIKENKRIFGLKCTECGEVLVPPLVYCPKCFAPTEEWVEVADRGIAVAPVAYMLKFPGQLWEPPIVVSMILLDGASTPIQHRLDEVDHDKLVANMRVEAVWEEERNGSMHDIKYFRPIDG